MKTSEHAPLKEKKKRKKKGKKKRERERESVARMSRALLQCSLKLKRILAEIIGQLLLEEFLKPGP